MVAGVIVLYNPNMLLLDRLLRGVIGQVDRIFVIDNTPAPTDFNSSYFDQCHDSISYVPLGENKGIATAQNVGIRASLEAGYSHVLLLDQDSALPGDMVKKLLEADRKLILAGKKVAAVGPLFVDEKTGEKSSPFRQGYSRARKIEIGGDSTDPVETEYVIASGSLIRREVIQDIGMMLDELFIDLVDIEWGLRAKSKGYQSYIVPSVVIAHSVGDRAIQVFGRSIYLHGDTRNYYRIRNGVYLLRLRHMGMRWRISSLLRVPKYVLIYSLLSRHRLRTLMLLCRACVDGMRAKNGRYR